VVGVQALRTATPLPYTSLFRSRAPGKPLAHGHDCCCSLQIVRGAGASSSRDSGTVHSWVCWLSGCLLSCNLTAETRRCAIKEEEERSSTRVNTTHVGLT